MDGPIQGGKGERRTRRPSTSRIDENIQRVHDSVKADHRIITRMIAEKLGINNGNVQTILKEDLNMQKLRAKIVPKILVDEQKQRRDYYTMTGSKMPKIQIFSKR